MNTIIERVLFFFKGLTGRGLLNLRYSEPTVDLPLDNLPLHSDDYHSGSYVGSLDDLSDVALGTPAAGNALVYDGTVWEAGTVSSVVNLDDLADVTLGTPVLDNILKYDGTVWVSGTAVGGSGTVSLDQAYDYGATIVADAGDVRIERGGLDTDKLFLHAGTDLTISGGTLTVEKNFHFVNPESGTADNIQIILGGADHQVIIIAPKEENDSITIQHDQQHAIPGNILLWGEDVTVTGPSSLFMLYRDPFLDAWRPMNVGISRDLAVDAIESEALELNFDALTVRVGASSNPLASTQKLLFGQAGTVNQLVELNYVDSGSQLDAVHGICCDGTYAYSVARTSQMLCSWNLIEYYKTVTKSTAAGHFNEGVVLDISGDQNYAAVCGYTNNKVIIYDISERDNITFLSEISHADMYHPASLRWYGNYLYISCFGDPDGAGAFYVYDVTVPASPVFKSRVKGDTGGAGTWNLKGASDQDIWEVGATRYAAVVSRLDDALHVIDVTNGTSTIKDVILASEAPYTGTNSYELEGALSVKVRARGTSYYAYVATRWQAINQGGGYDSGDRVGSLTIFNVTTPTAISHVSEIHGTRNPYLGEAHWVDVDAGGSYAFVGVFSGDEGTKVGGGLTIVDCGTITAPVQVGTIRYSEAPGTYKINGLTGCKYKEDEELVFVPSYWGDAVVIIDVSTKTAPKYMGGKSGAGYPNKLDGCHSVGAIDHYMVWSSRLGDDAIGIATYEKALMFSSQPVGTIATGGTVYLNGASGVKVMDNDSRVFVVSYTSGAFSIFSKSNPAAMTMTKEFRTSAEAGAIALDVNRDGIDPIAAVAAFSANQVNLYNLTTLTRDGTFGGTGSPYYCDGPWGVYFKDESTLLYTSRNGNAFGIVNVGTLASPSLRSIRRHADNADYLLDGALGVVAATIGSSDWAFIIARDSDALTIWNIDDLTNPTLVASFSGVGAPYFLDEPYAIDIHEGTKLYVATYGDDSLLRFDVSDPQNAFLSARLVGTNIATPTCVSVKTAKGIDAVFMANYTVDRIWVGKDSDIPEDLVVGFRNRNGDLQGIKAFGDWTSLL